MADLQVLANQRINCWVHNIADGSKHLVFEVAGTGAVVGELRVAVADPRYLGMVAQLFTQWTAGSSRVSSRPSELSAAIKRAINGRQ